MISIDNIPILYPRLISHAHRTFVKAMVIMMTFITFGGNDDYNDNDYHTITMKQMSMWFSYEGGHTAPCVTILNSELYRFL